MVAAGKDQAVDHTAAAGMEGKRHCWEEDHTALMAVDSLEIQPVPNVSA